MLDQINGLPVHALVLHAAVIFVPLLAVGAIVYVVLPRWRPKIGWAVGLLAIVAPICTLVAVLSGRALYDRLVEQGVSGTGKEILDDHMGYGSLTFWFALALGVVSLIMVVMTWRRPESMPKPARLGLSAAMVVLALVTAYFVFQTGDSGATAVWGSY